MQFEHLFFEGIATAPRRKSGCRTRALVRPGGDEPAEQVSGFIAALLQRANLSAASYRGPALHRRTAACLRFLGVASADEGLRRIECDPRLTQSALSVALLGVTEFFRDQAVFERLGSAVLPELLARRGRIRVWSAACSSGHELYSVAMLLAELGRLADAELLGTDCRADAIEQARAGAFDWEAVASLAPFRRERYFTRYGNSGLINADLRWATEWRQADLLAGVERGPWDLILWRNMAIYLEEAPAEEVWARLTRELAPGGLIVCGKADHPPAGLPLERIARCFYQLSGSI
ncbi:CheR family methyltransferase [Opitutus terrae]|uniref:MCP methyltransferase, CheR-type n=1 Tax=Opitutus terrae (strain DSM 11246 / JCM 15787 / PB90-1) TaxID=452637 RepID=B1ZWA1_OPITP|nr:CheR family methyltransferase [Opitutus terrae]ACB76853.1 MCP methyltransferase, CheR-type [Opitutus terrae PB90-1]